MTTPPTARRLHVLRRLALLCAMAVLAVTSLSAFIRQSRAGLGCDDWPACYGQSLREAQRGVAPTPEVQTASAAARLAHRVLAVLALLLVVTMLFVCFGSRPVLVREGALALALLGLALFLAVLGRWSSEARVPAVAIGNLLGGFVMAALSVRLAAAGRVLRAPLHRGWIVLAVAVLLFQVALGGLVSASYGGLACNAPVDCSPAALWQAGDWQGLDPWREPRPGVAGDPAGAAAHGLHRLVAIVLVPLLLGIGIAALRRGRRRIGVLLLGLLGVQLATGAMLAVLGLPLAVALVHNLIAAALLAALLRL